MRFGCIFLLLLAIVVSGVTYSLTQPVADEYKDTNDKYYQYDRAAYMGLFFFFFMTFLVVDYLQKFDEFQSWFEKFGNNNGQRIWASSFGIIAFTTYILIAIWDMKPNHNGLTIAVYVLFYFSLPLAFASLMSFWTVISFYFVEKPWVHGFMWMSVFGGFVVVGARWIHPPREGDWHYGHEPSNIMSGIIFVCTIMFVFLVVLAGIGIAAFAEFGILATKIGSFWAFFAFCVVAMIVMLTPLAPGNIVDVCGGFVFVKILMDAEKWDFFSSLAVAMWAVICLHWIGACAQWYIGKQPCVQGWANFSLPIPMLAASDAVLKEADFIRVGLIGYVFMDTANGLNQGRINMEFWTQLLSEWACIPNAIPLVSLGATVALSGEGEGGVGSLVVIGLPILTILASIWQMLGTSFGASAMGSSTDGVKYWSSREKWEVVQKLHQKGFTPTQKGWVEDLYEIGKLSVQGDDVNASVNEIPLWDKIEVSHNKYLTARDKCEEEVARMECYEVYTGEVVAIRENHMRKLLPKCERMVKAGEDDPENAFLVYADPPETTVGFFDEPGRLVAKGIVCFGLVMCFWASISLIWWKVSMQEAVKNGLKVLNHVTVAGWVAFAMFMALEFVYYHREIIENSGKLSNILVWTCMGCKGDDRKETLFDMHPEYVPLAERDGKTKETA